MTVQSRGYIDSIKDNFSLKAMYKHAHDYIELYYLIMWLVENIDHV